jgi:hypothetical protein
MQMSTSDLWRFARPRLGDLPNGWGIGRGYGSTRLRGNGTGNGVNGYMDGDGDGSGFGNSTGGGRTGGYSHGAGDGYGDGDGLDGDGY